MKPDLSLLYSEISLTPDCNLDDFKRAYRRRIAQLHPDRTRADPSSPEAQAALCELLLTYVAVKRFHRRYGRMPGASTACDTLRVAQTASRSNLPIPVPADDGPERARPTVPLAILFIVLLVVLAYWDWLAPGS